ncbi:hypothetical protein O6H91_13G085000 [Diphasiastrum complanatum]|uniref:Uncharacterized protein n=2 Tax=Diphasiastrum complanatum TaxID=34168 RepID=A0ACC2BWL9_DIPCM|nr:hypothetical protein O6H91_13G083400 [Diphasiastrum complanatum]KAJ7534230.1 hypothetical protein O6H91_13G085000 [Diphasiastrum complanatum]
MEPTALIPGLPEEIAWTCFVRVSYEWYPHMQVVCRRWKAVLRSEEFHKARKRAGSSRHCVCMVQALPPSSTAPIAKAAETSIPPIMGISVYDLHQRSWMKLCPVPRLSQGAPLFSRCVCSNGKLILLGGWNPTSYATIRSVYIFDFYSRKWCRGSDMLTSRSFFACSAVDGHVFVAGGHDGNKDAMATAEVYSVEDDRWRELPRMSEERDECGGFELNGKFYVVSGYHTQTQGQFVQSGEVYDPKVGNWKRIENVWMKATCSAAITAVACGKLHDFNGQEVLCYNADLNSWVVVDAIPEGRPVAACSTTPASDCIVVATASCSGHLKCKYKLFLYKPSLVNDSVWTKIESEEEDFSGLIQSLCMVEL